MEAPTQLSPWMAAPERPVASVIADSAKTDRAISRSLAIAGGLGMALAALLVLLFAGVEVGPVAFATAVVLALLPVPLWVALALWIDRYEPEPRWMIATAFFWGASFAVLIALILNTAGELIVGAAAGADAAALYGYSISAPVVEECAKAFVIFLLYRRRRSEFDGIVDGIVYAIMVGLGFAMVENVLYYGRGAYEEGLEGAIVIFVLRGLLSPFAHPLFTAMTGIGFGIASRSARRWVRFVAPTLGLIGAIVLHSVWNTSAVEGLIVGVYFLFMVPVFGAVTVLVIAARRREGRVIREELQPDVGSGLLSADEARGLGSMRARRKAIKAAKRQYGKQARRPVRAYQHAATELAFLRHRVRKGLLVDPQVVATEETGCLNELRRLRAQLPEPGAAPRGPEAVGGAGPL